MSNKLIVILNVDYGQGKKGDEVEMEYFEGRNLVNANGAKLVRYADEKPQQTKEAKPAADRQTKEDKQAAKIKTK